MYCRQSYRVDVLQHGQFLPKSTQQPPNSPPARAKNGMAFLNSKGELWGIFRQFRVWQLCLHRFLSQKYCTKSRYQGQTQVITSHSRYCGIPVFDIWFWHKTWSIIVLQRNLTMPIALDSSRQRVCMACRQDEIIASPPSHRTIACIPLEKQTQ